MKDVPTLSVDLLRDLDLESPVSRYRQIADQLARAILDQRPGVRLPSEHEIVARFGVSRATATQALRDLEQRGLVVRRQGKGTFVTESEQAVRSDRAGSLPSFSEDLRAAGRKTNETVLALEVVAAPAEVAAALDLSTGDGVWCLERVIVSDGVPVVHLTSWLPHPLVPALTRAAIERESLYHHLAEDAASPGRPVSADERWTATVAPPATAVQLDIPRKAPVMRVVRVAYLADGRAIEYAIAHTRGEAFAVSIHIDVRRERNRVLAQFAGDSES